MTDAVHQRVALDYPLADGSRLRDHLLQVAKITGERDPRLDSVEPPIEGSHLWNMFWEINTTRSPGCGLLYTEIQAYSRLFDIELSPWEIDSIKSMDIEYLNTVGQKQEEQNRQQRAKSKK